MWSHRSQSKCPAGVDLFNWTGNHSHAGSFLSGDSHSPLRASSSKIASSSRFPTSGVTFLSVGGGGDSLHSVKDWAQLYLQEFWKNLILFLVLIARPSLPTSAHSCQIQLPQTHFVDIIFFNHGNLWRFQSKDKALEPGIQSPPNGFPSDFYQIFKKEYHFCPISSRILKRTESFLTHSKRLWYHNQRKASQENRLIFFMNMDVKILNKMLANQTQQYRIRTPWGLP